MTYKELRNTLNTTQTEFAKMYKIPYKTYQQWEEKDAEVNYLIYRAVMEDADKDFPDKPYILGFNLKRIIDYSHLSQIEFCEKYKIQKATLSRWKNGKRKPKEYFIELLERFVREDTQEPWKSYIENKKLWRE